MTTTTVLDETCSDGTTVLLTSRNAAVGGAWTAVEVISGNGPDSARVVGGTGFAFSSSGAAASGNRSGLLLTTTDWDVYFEVNRPSGVFGGVWLMGGANTSGVGGWVLWLSNFADEIRLYSDSTSFAAIGTQRVSAGHAMPTGLSTYQLSKRGADLSLYRNGSQLGTTWTDSDPTAGSGVVAFSAAQSDNIGISRIWATIEESAGSPVGAGLITSPLIRSRLLRGLVR